jgi:hypothetical protein
MTCQQHKYGDTIQGGTFFKRGYMDTWNHFYFFRIVHTIAKIYPCIAKSLLNKKGTNHHNQNQGETQRYKGEIFLSRQKEAG